VSKSGGGEDPPSVGSKSALVVHLRKAPYLHKRREQEFGGTENLSDSTAKDLHAEVS